MTSYMSDIESLESLVESNGRPWAAINPEYAVRMQLQNRFKTGLDIAKYTAGIMRRDMAEYDADSASYTQSLGCWHGFIGQQKMISVKKHHGTTAKRYLYLSGLDGCRPPLRARPASRPVDAREDHRAGVGRGALHLPQAGRRP